MEKDRLGFSWPAHPWGSVIFLPKWLRGRECSPALLALGVHQDACACLSSPVPSQPAAALGGKTKTTQSEHMRLLLSPDQLGTKTYAPVPGEDSITSGGVKSYPSYPLPSIPQPVQIYRASNLLGRCMLPTDPGRNCSGKDCFLLVNPVGGAVILLFCFQAEVFGKPIGFVLLQS